MYLSFDLILYSTLAQSFLILLILFHFILPSESSPRAPVYTAGILLQPFNFLGTCSWGCYGIEILEISAALFFLDCFFRSGAASFPSLSVTVSAMSFNGKMTVFWVSKYPANTLCIGEAWGCQASAPEAFFHQTISSQGLLK